MKTKEEIKKRLLENCIDEYANLDLSNLDFSDFDGDVDISGMKVKWDLCQDHQKVSGDLCQYAQEVKGDLFQSNQKVKRDLYQDYQKVGEDLIQQHQEVKGTIFQDTLTNANIDKQIKALKKIISLLEKQKY